MADACAECGYAFEAIVAADGRCNSCHNAQQQED